MKKSASHLDDQIPPKLETFTRQTALTKTFSTERIVTYLGFPRMLLVYTCVPNYPCLENKLYSAPIY